MKYLTFLTSVSCVLLTNCASIVSKSSWPVTINSNPSGATVLVKKANGELVHQGVTPTSVTLKSSDGFFKPASYTLDFKKKGYPSQTVTLSASMNGWYAGNILFGGLVGLLIVDPATGAMWKLDESVTANLNPIATLDDGNGRQIKVIDKSTLPAPLQQQLIALN